MGVYISTTAATTVVRKDKSSVLLYRGQGIDGAVVDPGNLEFHLERGNLAKLEAQEAKADDKPATVPEILAEVGEDAEKAREVLEAEHASEKPRSGLIKGLEAVIAKAEQV